MIKDTKISEIFQVPRRMLQRWKNSNDYRYLIYTYLHSCNEDEVEAFFKFLTLKKAVNYGDEDYKQAIKFFYKKDFLIQIEKPIGDYLKEKEEEVHIYNPDKIKFLFNEEHTFDMGSSSFFVKPNFTDVVYVELSNRVLEAKPLLKKIEQINSSLKVSLVLKKMIFITTEKQLPAFLRDKKVFNEVIVENINIDDFSSKFLGVSKVIFVPPGMKLPS